MKSTLSLISFMTFEREAQQLAKDSGKTYDEAALFISEWFLRVAKPEKQFVTESQPNESR